MARRTSGDVNKSKAVREYIAAHRKAKPRQIVEAMKAQGIVVTANYASNIKSTMKRKKRKGGPGKAAAAATNGVAGRDYLAVIKLLKAAQAFTQQAGGVRHAKQALDAAKMMA